LLLEALPLVTARILGEEVLEMLTEYKGHISPLL
jgi:hypothetical protein